MRSLYTAAVIAALGMASGAFAIDPLFVDAYGTYEAHGLIWANGWDFTSKSISNTNLFASTLTAKWDGGQNPGSVQLNYSPQTGESSVLDGLLSNFQTSQYNLGGMEINGFVADVTVTSATGVYKAYFPGNGVGSGTTWTLKGAKGLMDSTGGQGVASQGNMSLAVAPVPEPFTMVLGAGALAAAVARRRRATR